MATLWQAQKKKVVTHVTVIYTVHSNSSKVELFPATNSLAIVPANLTSRAKIVTDVKMDIMISEVER